MAMFCPVCKVEYRDGFTRCSDCDVALVDHLPTESPADDRDAPRDADGRELLWSGVDSNAYDAIRDALDAARVAHKDTSQEFGLLQNFRQSAQFIWIDPRDREAARVVLSKVLAESGSEDRRQGDANSDHLAWMDPFNARREVYSHQSQPLEAVEDGESFAVEGERDPLPNDLPEDFDAEEATAEVWAGDDVEMAQFLKDSLSGVGIGCVIGEDGGKNRLLVRPADQSRAREIVREVVEGTPQE